MSSWLPRAAQCRQPTWKSFVGAKHNLAIRLDRYAGISASSGNLVARKTRDILCILCQSIGILFWARHPQDPPTRTLACRRVTSLCRSRIHRRKWGPVAVRDSVMLFGSKGNKKQEVTSAFTQGHSSRPPTGQLPSLSAALLDHAHGWIPGQLESFWLVDPGLHCERQ